MAFRSKEAAFAGLALLALPALAEFRYEARHDHWRKGGDGTLVIGDSGVSFHETGNREHNWNWAWHDIQQLELGPRRLRVLTYEDNKWKLGSDRQLRFDLRGDSTFLDAYRFLRGRLDQRLVAVLADRDVKPVWEVPVKHLERFGGSHGVLVFGEDRVVYNTDKKGEARTWRYGDLAGVSSTGPFRLTLTAYERARSHYGGLKDFNFQLKQPLEESRYNQLWRRLNRSRGLEVLTIKETE